MRTSYSIRFMTHVAHDRALLKSVLATFGEQPDASWHYQEEGAVDVIMLDADTCSVSELALAHAMCREIIFYTADMSLATQKSLVLQKPAHAKEMLSILKAAAKSLHGHSHPSMLASVSMAIQSTTSATLKALTLDNDKSDYAF